MLRAKPHFTIWGKERPFIYAKQASLTSHVIRSDRKYSKHKYVHIHLQTHARTEAHTTYTYTSDVFGDTTRIQLTCCVDLYNFVILFSFEIDIFILF